MAVLRLPDGRILTLETWRRREGLRLVVAGLRLRVRRKRLTIAYARMPGPRTHPEDRVDVQEQIQVRLDAWLGVGQARVAVHSLTPPLVRVVPV